MYNSQPKYSFIPLKKEIISLRKDLARTYKDFSLESKIRTNNRDPYRCAVLFLFSSSTSDKKLNEVMERFFEKYPRIDGFLRSSRRELLRLITPLGRQNKNIVYLVELRNRIGRLFNKAIPSGEDDYRRLPGFGEKIWECVLGYGFGKNALPIDSHCKRVFILSCIHWNANNPIEAC